MASLCGFFKRLAAVAVALGASYAAQGQTHYASHVWIGGRAGMDISRMDMSPSITQSWHTGTAGAVSIRYSEEKLFGLLGEFGWIQRGWKENFEDSPLEYSRTLTYLRVPVMTQITFGTRRFKCNINLGPEVSYMIADNISSNFDYQHPLAELHWPEVPRQYEHLAMDIANKFDYGIAGGIGAEFYVQPRHSITLEARYYFGLGNIFKSSKADVYSASRCTSVEVTVGYYFRLK